MSEVYHQYAGDMKQSEEQSLLLPLLCAKSFQDTPFPGKQRRAKILFSHPCTSWPRLLTSVALLLPEYNMLLLLPEQA